MTVGMKGSFAAQLKTLREAAGYTQEELATIAGVSVHAVSALERGERRRPHVDTVRALSAALERVRDLQPGFQLTAANGPTVAAICRRLDALPLALELV